MMSSLVPKLRFDGFSGEWEEKQINEILTIGSGRDYKKLSDGNIPVYGTGGYMLSVNDYLYDGESVCIGRKGTIDKPVFLTGKFWTVDTLFYTHSFKENIPKFIYLLFQKINWYKYNEASGVPSLSKVTIGKINIFIPKPKEQQKIANTLSSLDSLMEATEKKIEALKKHKKGLMQQLFPADGQKVPKLRFDGFSREWEEKELSKISNITTGSSNREDSTANEGQYTFFDRSQDIRTSSRYLFDDEAIIIAGEGQKFTPKYYNGKFDLHQRTYAILESHIIGKFLYYYTDKYKHYFLQNAVGSTVKSLRLPMFQKMPILLPTLPEQQKIANTLSSLDSLIESQNKKIEALKKHKKGLMQQMFVGGE